MSGKYEAPSVKKAFQILRLVSLSEEGMGISELAKALRISKGTVHGISSALEDIGAIRRDPSTKKFTLGITLFELGRLAYSQVDLKALARPVMEELMEKTKTSVFLGVLNRDHVTILDVVESREDLKITSPIGITLPLMAGAAGKVFLSMMPEADAMRLVGIKGLVRYTKHSISVPGVYFEELAKVRERGYAVDDEEYILGVRAVAAPIVGERRLMSAIWAVGFKASLDEERMKALAEETKWAADRINGRVSDLPDFSTR
ncbi:MAG: IclR family transcriptional regulator [Deltaproteobacteria bacterium]|nr:IclR family transcriptional regulator [Deltaproteobacteria bacterium]